MKLLTFGEILYDVFENKSVIGGAPLNFSAHFTKLGGKGYILSAVGKDKLGEDAVEIVKNLGVNTKYISYTTHPTGICKVSCNNEDPVYDLSMVCAYDNIEISKTDEINIENEGFDVLYFGTLALRNEVSRRTIEALLRKKCFKNIFFDMNLRQNYYTAELIEKSLNAADIVKINRDEFEKLKTVRLCSDEKSLCTKFNIKTLLLTLDKDGMVLYDAAKDEYYHSSKPENKVVSTVGAGDASSACFLYNYLSDESPEACIERANIMGDYIVTFTEAIPEYSNELLNQLKNVSPKR